MTTKALEVLVNGEVVGLYVPPEGECFNAIVANIPRSYMRAQVLSGNESENWQWQLPDIKEGETIAFRLVDANGKAGTPPHRVTPKNGSTSGSGKKRSASASIRIKKKKATRKK